MKLENVQIEIRNKEHYEAVKKRLKEIKAYVAGSFFLEYAEKYSYKVVVFFHSPSYISCKETKSGFSYNYKIITLDDLCEVDKKRVIKDRFEVWSVLGSVRIMHICNNHQEAVDFIKKQKLGRYELKYYYEVVEE